MARSKLEFNGPSEQLWLALDERANDMDLSTSTYARAVLEGALKRGIADSLAMQALEGVAVKRRGRPQLPWVRIDDGAELETGQWAYRDWTMERLGDANSWRNAAVEDGWYLTGPGHDATFLALRRQDATDRANFLILQQEASE